MPTKAILVAINAKDGCFDSIVNPVPNCQIKALDVKRKNKKLTLDFLFLRATNEPMMIINMADKRLGIACRFIYLFVCL